MKKFLTIDIGGSFIKHALIDDKEVLTQSGESPTPNTMVDFLAVLEKLIASYQEQISGVCIACPGQINARTGFIHKGGLLSYLKSFPLKQFLTDQFSLPVSVINDANAAGLAEAQHGELADCQCGAVLVLGTGVGLALLSHGDLLSAKNFDAADILIKEDKKEEGGFKEKFSPDTISSLFNLHLKGLESLWDNKGSAVQFIKESSAYLGLADEDGRAVFQALNDNKDAELHKRFEAYCREIAYLILNLQSIFRLELVAIGGGISSQPLLIKEIDRQYRILLSKEPALSLAAALPIKACRYHNEANLIGAFCHFKKQNTKERGFKSFLFGPD
ncbi:ROK family protein [Streptococcus sp. H31]|uniref:ROK family protein n=1 Tax=Streptococcus huangxiaojuni TaxID=3237239 RepID=UPI0034A58FCC